MIMKCRKLLVKLGMMLLLAACGHRTSTGDGQTGTYIAASNSVFKIKIDWIGALSSAKTANNQAKMTFLTGAGAIAAPVIVSGFHPRMPAHGHGTIETNQRLTQSADEPNVFFATGVEFIMAGAANMWVIDVEATVDGGSDSATVPIPVEVK